MLSSRGSLSTQSLMMECAAAQSRDSKRVFLLSELEKSWTALARVLRYQLTQNTPVSVPKLMSFWFDTKLVVTDGPLRYSVRVPQCGFVQSFSTTYGLDSVHVPQAPAKLQAGKVPMDQLTAASGVPANMAAHALNEFFLFLGECLFQGKVLNLEFPGLLTIIIKREKAIATFDSSFLQDLFAIDSRKWPPLVREMAAGAVMDPTTPRPRTSSSARPRSSSSSRPPTEPRKIEERPAFCAGAVAGRLFQELEQQGSRPLPKKLPKVIPGKHVDPTAARSPMRGPQRGSQPQPLQEQLIADTEEESVYDILSSRHIEEADLPLDEPQEEVIEVVDEEEFFPPAKTVEVIAEEPEPLSAYAQRRLQPSTVRDLLFGAAPSTPEQSNETPRTGRRRFGNYQQTSSLSFVFQQS